jgi:cardiolipin synthase
MKHIPNIITVLRIIMAPLFPFFYFSTQFSNGRMLALAVFIIAGFSDLLDGFLARKFDVVSQIGVALDPLADKLMLISVLISLWIDHLIPLIIPIIVITKEVFMIILSSILYYRRDRFVIPSNFFGKFSTFLFFVSIFITLLFNTPVIHLTGFALAIFFKFVAISLYFKYYRQTYSSRH